jgi:hypothetical protein
MNAEQVRPTATGSSFREESMRHDSDTLARRATAALRAARQVLLITVPVVFTVAAPLASAAERAYRLQPFPILELDLPAHYVVRNASAPGALVRGQKEVLERIVVEQHDDRVRIYASGNLSTQEPLVVEVDTVGLTEMSVSGSGQVEATGLAGPEFSLKQLGAADISVAALDVDKLDVQMQGSGKIELSGRASKEQMRLAGAGQYRAARLAADKVEVKLEGAGDVEVMAREKLEVRISGAGTVRYMGDPKLSTHIDGAGTVGRM